MASAWIKSQSDIWNHWKTLKLVALLKITDVQAVGHLTSLWHFVLDNAWKDGDLENWGDAGIERAARWEGEDGELVSALRAVKYLDNYVVHGWLERAGKLVTDRIYNEDKRENCYAVKRRKYSEQRRKTGARGRVEVDKSRVDNKRPTATREKKEYTPDFLEFWKAYPNGTNKAGAFKSWLKIAPGPELAAKIVASVEAYKLTRQWSKDDGDFIPHATTFLNQGRYNETPKAPSANGDLSKPVPGKYDGF